jgi:hypothetical protein
MRVTHPSSFRVEASDAVQCRPIESNDVLSLFRRALNDHTSSVGKNPRRELHTRMLV